MSSPPVSRPPVLPVPKTVIAASSRPSHSKSPHWVDILLFWFDWGIKVLGIAAAVVFGIWAPLSYDAANKANDSNDAAQESTDRALYSMRSQASEAAAQQTAALDAMNKRIGAIGQLRLLEFCSGNSELPACQSFTNGISVPSLVGYLASTTSATPSATASPPSTSGGPKDSLGRGVSLSPPAILGIVFALILFLGIVAGIFVSQLKRHKRKRLEEE